MAVWALSLSTMDLITHSLSAAESLSGIRSLVRFGKALGPPSPSSALPPEVYIATHYLNSFRGEPAISQFDWPFTPNHNSSETFSTGTGSVLQLVLPNLQPGHG
jgi:hypothetical protein